jgi:transcriptional regulator with XRE-family HTH domain
MSLAYKSASETMGKRIRSARLARKISLEKLGQKLGGLSKVSVWSWEVDRSSPRKDRLISLAEALEVSPEWLIHGDDVHSRDCIIRDSKMRIAEAYGVDHKCVEIRVLLPSANRI